MSTPLSDITVIDLSHVLAGPYCTMMLSDLGARVIKIERPGLGDDTRAFPPFRGSESAYFATINRGKESIALDLKNPDDRALFEQMLPKADVLVENFRPGVMERLGYGWEDLHAKYPRLIYAAVSGFGHTGPDAQKPAYDMVVQARGGVMSITGEKDREPVRVGASVGDIIAGSFLSTGVIAALYERTQTGQGRKIDVAMLDSQIAILEHAVAITGETGIPPAPSGARHPSITPFETFHAKNGLFVIAAGNDVLFAKMCEVLGLGPLLEDPRFASNAARCKHVKILKRLIETVTLARKKKHWLKRLDAAGVPCAAIQNVAEAMSDPQILARNMVVELAAPDGGKPFLAAGNPIKISGMDDTLKDARAPTLDGDRQAVLDWLSEG
ncbi:CaiB/BaiF CoA transferase family protein [Profundibacter amoris]|uniref:CoA transferase n=1 Tax=Profundibacter amoris TaxID=2171755 RepID=A0A347UFZ9_9RHOB|nr:CaiB/BaiF CoA-transferase family protein [Profundibacter amoris]AXX97777.1 CoA transferase [Profundibacter amoris]